MSVCQKSRPVSVLAFADEPALDGLRVEVAGTGRVPRCVERDGRGQRLESGLRVGDVHQRVLVEPERLVGPAAGVAVDAQEVIALLIGREGGEPELVGERQDAVLGRADPLPAELDDRAVGEGVVERAPAHPVASLQHDDAAALLPEAAGSGQAGETGSHDDDINGFHQDRFLSRNGAESLARS